MTKYEKKILPIFVIDRFGMSLFLLLKISLFILFLPLIGHTQNLVPNGSFEEYDVCPETMDQISNSIGWYSVLNSCDYFNECSTVVGVPDNPQSFQEALEGNGYCGFHTYAIVSPEYREIIGTPLTESLNPSTKYYFSFWINKADKGENIKATNNIGLKFSSTEFMPETELIDNQSHFNIDTICYNSQSWNFIKGSFISQDNYSYLFIGNFYTDINTLTDGPGTIYDRLAYYNIDDIRLSTDSTYSWILSNHETVKPLDIQFIYSIELQKLLITGKHNINVQVFDATGKKICSIDNNHTSVEYNTNDLANGIYLVTATGQNNIKYTYKFLKL